MQFIIIYSVLFAVAIGSSAAIFDSIFQPPSGCTVLLRVPLVPADPYFKAEQFQNLNAKLAANQDRYNRNLKQVWVDAPDPSFCYSNTPILFNIRCCLNGYFDPDYLPNHRWTIFKTGDKKKQANELLWQESQAQRLPYYKVWADAPDRYCTQKHFGGLGDFFGLNKF